MGTGWADAAGAQSVAQDTGDLAGLLRARLLASKLAWAQQNAQAMDATGSEKVGPALASAAQADFIARRKGMDPTEDRIAKRQEFEVNTGLKKQDAAEKQREFDITSGLTSRERDTQEAAQAETGRHNRASESIDLKRIATSGANRTVQVRSVDPNTGQETVEFLTPQEAHARGVMKAPPTAAAKKEMADTQAGLESLQNINSLYRDEYVGPLAGRMGSFQNYTGLGATPERASFATAVAALKNQVIKDITGKQMSGAEAQRILDAVPDVTQPPVTFKARMEETRKNLERMRQSVGVPTPAASAPAAAPAAATSAYDLYLQRMKGGG